MQQTAYEVIKTPEAETLIRVWEECHTVHPIRRVLALLDVASASAGVDWNAAPIGQRDRRLLELYKSLFGSNLETVTRCPRCYETLETAFSTNNIGAHQSASAAQASFKFRKQGCVIEYRLPNSQDLLEVTAMTGDTATARLELLRRCVLEAKQHGKRHAPEKLPTDIVSSLADDMAMHDPDADVQVQLSCPGCGYSWRVAFDIVSYFWSALDDWAQRTLADVHLLASAYSWSEQEILRLSATRRQHYVGMVRA